MRELFFKLCTVVSGHGTWLSREEGQGITEYALVLALIGLVAVVSLSLLGGKVTTILSTVGRST